MSASLFFISACTNKKSRHQQPASVFFQCATEKRDACSLFLLCPNKQSVQPFRVSTMNKLFFLRICLLFLFPVLFCSPSYAEDSSLRTLNLYNDAPILLEESLSQAQSKADAGGTAEEVIGDICQAFQQYGYDYDSSLAKALTDARLPELALDDARVIATAVTVPIAFASQQDFSTLYGRTCLRDSTLELLTKKAQKLTNYKRPGILTGH